MVTSEASNENQGCRGCGGVAYHFIKCGFNLRTHAFDGTRGGASTSPVLDSDRGHMAHAIAKSLERAWRMEAEGITEEDVWETRQNGAGLGDD